MQAEQTPEEAAERTLGYLARYASGVALRNDRLLAIEGDEVVFSYQDYRDHGRRKQMSLPGLEFLERFLQHVLPPQTRHIRHYGFLSPNQRGEKLPRIRRLLGCSPPEEEADPGQGDLRCQEEDAGHKCPWCGRRRAGGAGDPRASDGGRDHAAAAAGAAAVSLTVQLTRDRCEGVLLRATQSGVPRRALAVRTAHVCDTSLSVRKPCRGAYRAAWHLWRGTRARRQCHGAVT